MFILKSFISLPFSIYSTFYIEERFGFNKTTAKIFISDRCKQFVLAVLIGGLLLGGVLAFFVYAGLVFFGILFAPIDFFMGILLQYFSRKNEYAADRFAVETTRDPGSFISALKKLAVHNLSNLMPHPLYVALNYSHPPILERLRAIGKG